MWYLFLFNVILLVSILFAFSTLSAEDVNFYSPGSDKEGFSIASPLSSIRFKDLVFVVFVILLICISAFRDGSVFADNEEYVDSIASGSDRFEITWDVICRLGRSLGSPVVGVFLIYAIIGIASKSIAIFSMSSWPWLSLAVYASHFYVLQDCVQIRAGAASGLMLFALYFWSQNEKLKWLLFTLMAVLFQYSFIIALLIPLIDRVPLSSKFWFLLLFGAYVFFFLSLDISFIFRFVGLDIYTDYYSHYLLNENKVQVINMTQLLYTALALYMLYNHEYFSQVDRMASMWIKLFVISLCFLPVFSNIPVFAYRGSQIFGVVEIFVIPLFLSYKMSGVSIAFVVVFLLYSLNTQIFRCIAL